MDDYKLTQFRCRYPLLLNRVYKSTPTDHIDKKPLKDAQTKIEDIIEHINSVSCLIFVAFYTDFKMLQVNLNDTDLLSHQKKIEPCSLFLLLLLL